MSTRVRKDRSLSNDIREMEGGFSPTNQDGASDSHNFDFVRNAPSHNGGNQHPNGTSSTADLVSPVDTHPSKQIHPIVLQHKYLSWSRHLTLYTILGNIGMLLTVVSDNDEGVLSRVFCLGTYGHVFMEGSLLVRLLFPPSKNYQLQKLHNYWGVITVLALLLFGNSHGELLWAAESILTDSMSLILGAWLIQADVAPQVKLLGLSHFIHGVNFEFFLWFDIAALSATYEKTRGVFWVILVVCNAAAQVVFHGPVIMGKYAASKKPTTPSPRQRKKLVCLWLCHNIVSIPLVLVFSTLDGNHFYLEESTVLPLYQWMIYTVPLTGFMMVLGMFLKSPHVAHISLAEENCVEYIGKPTEFELEEGHLPTQNQAQEKASAASALGEIFSGISGSMAHAAFQLLLGAAFAVTSVVETATQDVSFLPIYIAMPLSIPMMLAGGLSMGRATQAIGNTLWKTVAGPLFFTCTLVSMFSISGTGLGYWSAWGILQQQKVLPAFLVITGTVYTAWSAWLMLQWTASSLKGYLAKGN